MKTLRSHAVWALALSLLMLWGARPAAGQTYRIGYFQVGSFQTSELTLRAFKEGLAERGWLERVTFAEDARYSPGWNIDQPRLEALAGQIMARQDLDLILVMGTRATRALLAANNHRTAILGMDITDPLAAGLVESPHDSGAANFTTLLKTDPWLGVFSFFHAFTGFKRLGLILSQDPDAAIFSHLETARKVARDRGFELVVYQDLESETDLDGCQRGIESLIAQGIDAFFMPEYTCFDQHIAADKRWFQNLNRHHIATFANEGSQMIRQGALMGNSNCQIEAAGALYAEMAIKILQGTSPGALPMLNTLPLSMALNLDTAQNIGLQFPFETLSVFDEIYLEADGFGAPLQRADEIRQRAENPESPALDRTGLDTRNQPRRAGLASGTPSGRDQAP